jgi:hypothetical protein
MAAGSRFFTLSWKPEARKFLRMEEKIVVKVD